MELVERLRDNAHKLEINLNRPDRHEIIHDLGYFMSFSLAFAEKVTKDQTEAADLLEEALKALADVLADDELTGGAILPANHYKRINAILTKSQGEKIDG